jgi:hypothetical protein
MIAMLKQGIAFSILILCALNARSQTGGVNSFQSLNYFYSARQLGLSGNIISVRDKDVNTVYSNPASLNSKMNYRGSLTENIRTGNINAGSLTYSRAFGKVQTAANFRYLSYGYQRRTDVNGVDLGSFSPGDFILGVSAAKLINPRMSIGGTFNFLYSQLDNYVAFANSIDIGGQYFNEDKNFVVSGVVKNLGVQWKSYTSTKSPLPLEVQLGVSKKLSHAPFRFHLTAQHLQKWDLSYNDPNAKDKIDPLTGDTIKVKHASFVEKVGRHALIQTEFLFGEKFHLRVGFDLQRRLEMKVASRPGLAGFSFGAAFHLKRFSFEYGWMIYSVAGSQHGITFSIPIGQK